MQATAGHCGPGNDSEPLVAVEDDRKSSRPGSGAKSYERGRTEAGDHLLFNVYKRFSFFKCACENHYIKLIMA